MTRRAFFGILAGLPFIGKVFASETKAPLKPQLKVVKTRFQFNHGIRPHTNEVFWSLTFKMELADGTTRDAEVVLFPDTLHNNQHPISSLKECVDIMHKSMKEAGVDG